MKTEFDVHEIDDLEILAPPIMRLIDRQNDVKFYKRRTKIQRFPGVKDRLEVLILLEDEEKNKTLSILEFRYCTNMETLKAILNSPVLVKVTNVYEKEKVEEVWKKV